MTNAEALAECKRLDDMLADRIAAGEIPPRPDPTIDGDAWRRWYDQHVRCVTPHHQFFMRERGSVYCKQCITLGSLAVIGVTSPLLTIPTTDGAEVCCYGMLVAGNQHSDDCDAEKRAQALPAPAKRKPRAMPT